MKVAVLGGSFNPLHIGHCILAEAVVRELGYDKVLFVPTYIPPHKKMNDFLSPEQRLEMLHLFCDEATIDGKRFFDVEDCEISRKGISYTFDTLKYIEKSYDYEGKIALLMGQESASQFNKWYNFEKIAEMVDFVIAVRKMDGFSEKNKQFENFAKGNYLSQNVYLDFEKNFSYNYIPLENPELHISSTEIRSRIYSKRAWRYLVPNSVFQYINKIKLLGKNND